MNVHGIDRRKPAARAATTARLLGFLIPCVVIILAGFQMLAYPPPLAQCLLITAMLAIYISPCVALLLMSNAVRRGRSGPTIATLVIATLVAMFAWYGSGLSLWIAVQTLRWTRFTSGQLLFFGTEIGAVAIASLATLLLIFCIQSLQLPATREAHRGFELLPEATPVEMPPTADVQS